MSELVLRRTWTEIGEYLSGAPDALRILRLINALGRQPWRFAFSFDARGYAQVRIASLSDLTFEQISALVDGSIEEVLFADALYLHASGRVFRADLASLLRDLPRSNLMPLDESLVDLEGWQLRIDGFFRSSTVPSVIQDKSHVRQFLSDFTWIGSPRHATSTNRIDWRVFGVEQSLGPESRYSRRLGSASVFRRELQLFGPAGAHIGYADFFTSPNLRANELFTAYGPVRLIDSSHFETSSAFDGASFWLIEVGSKALDDSVLRGEQPLLILRELLKALDVGASSLMESPEYRSYSADVARRKEAEAATRLLRRQERAQRSPKILIHGSPTMAIPSCENEVLALLCKLEGLGALPFYEFRIWEYTSRVGIDALVTFRIRDIDVPTQYGAVEVEYLFENFFDHEHPHQQVNLVVCWDFRGDIQPGSLEVKSPWLFRYRGDHPFHVLVLSKIPALRIEQGA